MRSANKLEDFTLSINHFSRIIKLLNRFGWKIACDADGTHRKPVHKQRALDFERQIRPDFIRHSISTQR